MLSWQRLIEAESIPELPQQPLIDRDGLGHATLLDQPDRLGFAHKAPK